MSDVTYLVLGGNRPAERSSRMYAMILCSPSPGTCTQNRTKESHTKKRVFEKDTKEWGLRERTVFNRHGMLVVLGQKRTTAALCCAAGDQAEFFAAGKAVPILPPTQPNSTFFHSGTDSKNIRP